MATISMVVFNVIADILYDLLEQDIPSLHPRSDCDVTYLYIKHIELNKHIPTNGRYGTLHLIPNTHIAIGDDIERIRRIRNVWMRPGTYTLDENEYEDLCGMIVDLAERFDQHNKPAFLYTDKLKEIFDKKSFEKEARFTKEEIFFLKMEMIIVNILVDVLYDLLKQDKPNLRSRNDCDWLYLYSEHRRLKIHNFRILTRTWQDFQSTDIAIGDDIERIRMTINEIKQFPFFYLEETRFNELCDILNGLLKRFDHHNKPTRLYTDELNKVLAKYVDSDDVTIMVPCLNEISI